MISVERTRELLNDPNLSETEVREIRNAFYALADLMLDGLKEKEIEKYEQR